MGGRQIRVLLVDDHEIVRRGLKSVLDGRGDLTVVGEAGTVAGAESEALRLRPDVVVMDLRLPDGSGVEACREILAAAPDTKIVLLTSYADENALYAAILAGASGFLLKDADADMLHDSLVSVAAGGSLLDPAMTAKVLDRLRRGAAPHPADDPFSELTPQEDRIFSFIGDGLTNREIANELSLSEKTVKNYVSKIYSKLNLERRSQAAKLAAERRVHREQV